TVFDQRRQFIRLAASAGLIAGASLAFKVKAATIANGETTGDARLIGRANAPAQPTQALIKGEIYNPRQKIKGVKKTAYGKGLEIDKYKDITTYNNYYEFGTSKSDPVVQARTFQPYPALAASLINWRR
ncbi:MAG TPA: hypothetical protein VLM20_03145, partial [Methylophilaceae bacterium]|nr:hypothetical protein [Methylophilaceae bacterium]